MTQGFAMTAETSIAWMLALGLLIQGVWLAGLTYMIWKRHKSREDEPIEPGAGTTV